MRQILILLLCALFSANGFAQSGLTIDRLDNSDIASAKKDVPFSTRLEGTVWNPELEVFVLVHEPHLKAWRAFPATVDPEPETGGVYRWRAICQFGELGGTGIGDNYEARAYALERKWVTDGLPEKIPSEALKTNVLVLRRTK